MAATASPQRNGSHLDLTPEEFERRLAARGHGASEIHDLWDELSAPEAKTAARRVLGLGPLIALYLGLLLVVAASVALTAIYWHGLGAGGILALAVAYLAAYLVASEALRRRGLTQPAEVLETVAVAWIGLATYAAQELAGVWPDGASDDDGIHSGITVIAIACLAAALALLALHPTPLLLVPIAGATVVLAADLAELVFGQRLDDLTAVQTTAFVLPVGVAWIAFALWLDVIGRREYATVASWCGLLVTGAALISVIPRSVAGFALIGVLGAVSLFFSAFVRHWSFTIVGAFGVLTATTSSIRLLHGLAPLVIAVVGIALIFVGVRWSSWRERLRLSVLAWMPSRLRAFIERLAP
jgi:hypothetical protein